MSRTVEPDEGSTCCCEWYGREVEGVEQDCPARDDGRCFATNAEQQRRSDGGGPAPACHVTDGNWTRGPPPTAYSSSTTRVATPAATPAANWRRVTVVRARGIAGTELHRPPPRPIETTRSRELAERLGTDVVRLTQYPQVPTEAIEQLRGLHLLSCR